MQVMSREREIESLQSIVLDRYEKAGVEISLRNREQIWYSLAGEYDRNGYEAAKNYAENARLLEQRNGICC